ncbi:MAG: glycoside hydrolase family 10 protein [Candidatus Promineifilaceae bacterium]
MRRIRAVTLVSSVVAILSFLWLAAGAQGGDLFTFLPVVPSIPQPTPTPSPTPPPNQMVEFRGLWLTRFDWTSLDGEPEKVDPDEILPPADPAKIDEVVNNAAAAGFNAIFFQVRGEADAFYQPGPEPWAKRVSGVALGQAPNPWWDPLAYIIERAHQAGLEVHAYMNVYPVWADCGTPPPQVSPQHLYHGLLDVYGATNGKPNGLQWNTADEVSCSGYLRATPASVYLDEHVIGVGNYLADTYAIDGIHLDHIRYAWSDTSCDPVSESAAGVPCFNTPPGYASYADFQRAQVNGTVSKFYDQVILTHPGLMLSAAVWPIYINYWGWTYGAGLPSEGYHTMYQDSKGWLSGGYIDGISPMIYGNDLSFWNFERWSTLVADYQADSHGRFVLPGIHAYYTDFNQIVARINAGRSHGTAGHAIFSYGGLYANGYFDDLAAGPYAVPAVVPDIPWHP